MSLLLCILNFSDYLPNTELLHFLQCSPTGPVTKFHTYSYLSIYMSVCTYIYIFPPFLHQLPLTAIFKSVPKAHEISQINKFCFCPSCQSISVTKIPGVGRVCILSPSSGTNPLEKRKMGFIIFQIISVPA